MGGNAKILRGSLQELELVINLKTAKQVGVTIQPNVPASADQVAVRREWRGVRREEKVKK